MYHPGAVRIRPVVSILMLLALAVAMLSVIPQGIETAAVYVYRICHAVENYLLWRICPSLNNGPDWGTVDLSCLDYGDRNRIIA
jgi:hypothetical protein